ncbi:hypothetical protein OT109_15050 [Phycisphaeraceae bacterium D3-23]
MTNRPYSLLQRLLASGAVGVLPVLPAAAQIDAFWSNAADGSWTTASNWSVDPAVPFNGFPNPLDRYHAWINAAGAPYTVTLDFNIEIDNLTLDSADATVYHTAGQLGLNGGTLDLRAGHYQLDGGTLGNMTITSSGGTLGLGSADHTFDGLTFDQIDLHVASGQRIFAPNDLVLNGGTFYLGAGGSRAELHTDFIDGSGRLVLNNADIDAAQQLVIARDTVVDVVGGMSNRMIGNSWLANRGTIRVQNVGTSLGMSGSTTVNTGTGMIEVESGAQLSISNFDNRGDVYVAAGATFGMSNLINTGTIFVEPGATIGLSLQNDQLSDLGDFTFAGTTVNYITNHLDLAGSVFDLAGSAWAFGDRFKHITNGTFTGPAGSTVSADGAHFTDIILDVDMLLEREDRAQAEFGFEVTEGHAIILRRTDGSGSQAHLFAARLDGAGELRFESDGASTSGTGARLNGYDGGPIEIGADFTVRAVSDDGLIYVTDVVNHGTIEAQNGYRIYQDLGVMTSHGTLLATNAGILQPNDLNNTGHLEANTFGAIYLDGNWSNTGTIHIDQATLRLGGQFDTAQLTGLSVNNAQVRIVGDLDATASPLTIDGSDNSNWVLGGFASVSPEARLTGAVTTVNGGRLIVTEDAVFSQLTLDGRIDTVDADLIRFEGDTTLVNNALIHFKPSGSTEARFAQVQSVLGNGEIVFDTPDAQAQISLGNSGELTLGPGVTLRTGDGSGRVHSGTLHNAGTIRAQGPGQTLRLDVTLNNTGTLEANNQGTIILSPALLTNTGSILIDGGALRARGNFTIDDLPGYTATQGGQLQVDGGDLDLLGQTWDTASARGQLTLRENGDVRNGLVDASNGVPLRVYFGGGNLYAPFIGELLIDDGGYASLNHDAPLDGQLIRINAGPLGANALFRHLSTPSGNAEVRFEGTGDARLLTLSNAEAFILSQGMTLRALGANAYVGTDRVQTTNHGTIRAENPGAVVHLDTDNLGINAGLIEAWQDTAIAFHGQWANDGVIRIADSDITTTAGDLTLFEGSTLQIEWAGPYTPGDAPVLDVADFTLGGTLDLIALDGYTPERGDALLFADADITLGGFDAFTLNGVATEDLFITTDTLGRRSFINFGTQGDPTHDGFVGVDDLDLLLANWGDFVTPGDTAQGDLNRDGLVGQEDLQIVLDHWGTGTPPANIPEPGTLALLALPLFATPRRRSRTNP